MCHSFSFAVAWLVVNCGNELLLLSCLCCLVSQKDKHLQFVELQQKVTSPWSFSLLTRKISFVCSLGEVDLLVRLEVAVALWNSILWSVYQSLIASYTGFCAMLMATHNIASLVHLRIVSIDAFENHFNLWHLTNSVILHRSCSLQLHFVFCFSM